MSYTPAQVARGRALVANLGRSKWSIGDLALEIMPAEADVDGAERVALENFAEEIGLSYSALRVYRKVSLMFPATGDLRHGRRDDTDWGVHAELRGRDDADAILHEQTMPWKVRTLRPRIGKASKDGDLVAPVNRAQRLAIASEVFRNEQDAAEVMQDRTTRVHANRAVVRAGAADTEATTRDFELANPETVKAWADTDKKASEAGHGLNTHAYLAHARLDLIHATESWIKADGNQGDLDRTLNSIIKLAQGLLDSESTSLDSALDEILAGGAS